ncbi:hypothetical protein BDN70DRAFT_872322 [Pholiota conissans]|uniref:Protein LCHN n=1 Tax=Pholiota conissans TaxID=109636 RepID=A0A9P5ZCD4_9AGAR|nr:hypothetical protein BDN70DRAFT_872322 [Pholiota conissans]
MFDSDSKGKYPQDLVAIFHASFHPTKGNIVDWSLKASDDLDLENLEFSALPSGLHLVEQDVVYFTKDGQHGVCVFRRRKTSEQGHRGSRLSSLGILLAKSHRPRPWRHVNALKELTDTIYARIAASASESGVLEPTEEDWEPARVFFEQRKLRRSDLGGAGDWTGWSDELDGPYADPIDAHPTLHLPHLLRILGPSALTLYKYVLGRKRILIYTLPPVEVASILCQVAGDLCFDCHSTPSFSNRLTGKHKEPINVLGMVTLNDMDRLRLESKSGRGWVACTTDALFMERPSYYDLLIDLTTSTPNKSSRPTFYASKPVLSQPGGSNTPSYKLSTIRFAWSDVKLWNEIDRILQLDSANASHNCCGPSQQSSKAVTTWTDPWQVYEDVCIICAGLWIGSWRGNSPMSYSSVNGPENWGAVHLEGDDDLSVKGTYVRNVGMGIEGRPAEGSSSLLGVGGSTSTKTIRRTSAVSWSSGKATVVNTLPSTSKSAGKARQVSTSVTVVPPSDGAEDFTLDHLQNSEEETSRRRTSQVLTTMALLQTFHAHTLFQLSVFEDILVRQGATSVAGASDDSASESVVSLTPRDIFAFELGPLSSLDAKYLEWLAEEYSGDNVKVVVKRGWRDLLGAIFGYA